MLVRAFDSQLFYAFFRPDVPVRFKSVASLKTGNGPRWHVSVNCSGKMCLEIIEMEAHFCLTACVFGPRPGPHPRTPRAFADRPLDWTGRGEAGKAGKALGSLGSSTAPWQVTRGVSRGFSAQESFFPSNAAAVFLGRRRFCPRFPAVCARARALHRGPGAARSLSHTQPERTRRVPRRCPVAQWAYLAVTDSSPRTRRHDARTNGAAAAQLAVGGVAKGVSAESGHTVADRPRRPLGEKRLETNAPPAHARPAAAVN